MSLNRARVEYRKPPLAEAIYQFTFDGERMVWKPEFWDAMRDRVAHELPEVTNDVVHELEAKHDHIEEGRTFEIRQYSDTHRSIVVTVGPTLIGLSLIPLRFPGGYPGRERVQEMALRYLDVYAALVGSRDAVKRVLVRYINRLPVVPGDFRVRSYLAEDCPYVPVAVLDEVNPFSIELSHILAGSERSLHAEAVSVAAGTGSTQHELLVTIDEVAVLSPGQVFGDLSEVCETLCDAAHVVFSRVFSEERLQSFDPIEMGAAPSRTVMVG